MADIFISFIHEEVEYAQCVRTFVQLASGFEDVPFLASDRFQIYAGEPWLDKIFAELKAAKVVLLMLSQRSVERPWVNFEAGAAWFGTARVIPVCFGGLTKGTLPKPYSGLQAVDLEDPEDQEYLAKSIAHHLGKDEPIFSQWMAAASSVLSGKEDDSLSKRIKSNIAARQFLQDQLRKIADEKGRVPHF